MRGDSKEVPGWILILQAAKEWGTPPWRIEDEATLLWWQRWRVWEDELSNYRKRQADKETAGGE